MAATHSPTALSKGLKSPLSGRFGGVCGCLFFSLFFAAGAGVMYMMAIGPWLKMQAAKTWDPTPCVIIASELEIHHGDGDTYSISVTYDYEVNGQKFTSTRYSFFSGASNSRGWREEALKKIPPGTQTQCLVDPDNPQEAVLEPGWDPDIWFVLLPAIFLLVGLVGMLGSLRYAILGDSSKSTDSPMDVLSNDSPRPAGAEQRLGSEQTINAWADSEFDDDDLEEPPGPVTLQIELSPWATFIGLTVFGLFWNGIVSIFIFNRPGGWGGLFLVPFVLIGIGIILGAIHQLLASFNPVPILTLSRQWIPLGSSAQLTWSFRGNPRSIRNLKVTLEGQEEATYRQGTSTSTDKNVFLTQVILDTGDPYEIAEGKALNIEIPSDTMHTFTGNNNKIVWRLKFHGSIPLWPDISATFPIRVMPHE